MSHEKDIVLKEFWRDNERFADLFNGTVFHGRRVVDARLLEEADTDVSGGTSTEAFTKAKQRGYKRNRDVVKKLYRGSAFVLLGLEDQANVHYGMPLRSMGYDFLNYTKEYNAIKRKNKREKNLRGKNRDEYLSGFLKNDRLHPVFTLVVYYGETPWDGPNSLRDMVTDMPEEMKEYFNDYRMNLVQIINSDPKAFKNPDVAAVFDLIQLIYRKDKKQMEEKYSQKGIDREVFEVVKTITAVDIKEVSGKERGEVKMWTALKEWQQESYESGKKAGERVGYESGKKAGERAGYESGKKAGERAGYESGKKAGERAGYESGKKAGYLSGEQETRRQLITQMLKNQWSAEAIHEATAIPLEEIKKVQETVCF